jgi:hypothetical protein
MVKNFIFHSILNKTS